MNNKKVYLHYLEFNLGFLTKYTDFYYWVPNRKNIELAKQKYSLKMSMFFLPEEEHGYNIVPEHFEDFLNDRQDLFKKAKILPIDDDFIKLYKLSQLDFVNNDFVIKSC